MYSIVYFSPTGNVLHLAEKLAGYLGTVNTEVLPLEFIEQNQLKNSRHLILLYPIHGFNAPRTVKRFVKNLPTGLYEFVSLLGIGCTSNWLNDAVSSDLKRTLIKKNYSILVDEILAMPLTFIMAFPDNVAIKLIAESEEKIKDLSLSVAKEIKSVNKIKGRSHLINFLGKAENPAARLFGLELHSDKNCTSCGICWNNCPEKNIKRNRLDKPRFGFNCIMCMRCIYNCPEKSISPRFSKFIPIKNGYSLNRIKKLQ
jgi:ferredoxin